MATRALTVSTSRNALAARRVDTTDVVAVGLAALLLLAAVIPTVGRRPFWFDELVSLEVASSSWSAFAEYLAHVEVNMALYHAVLRGWLWVAHGEVAVRMLSVFFALATLPLFYAFARRLYDRRTAVTAVLLLSVNVSFVGYSRDARSYALTLLLVTASSYALVRAVESERDRDWAIYGIAAGLMVWSHLFAALVLVAQVAWVVLERRGVHAIRGPAIAACVLGAVLLPLAAIVVLSGQEPQLEWLPRPGPQKLPGLLLWFVESRLTVVAYCVGVVVALLSAARAWRLKRENWPRRESLLLLWLLVPPVVAFLASYATPVYLYRYFLASLPALVLLAAAGFAQLRPRWLGIAVTVVALGLSVRTVEGCQPDCKIRYDDWEAAGTYLAANVRPGDALIVYPKQVRTGVHAYLHDERRPRLLYPESWELVGGAKRGHDDLASALEDVGRYERVWLVTWWLPADEATAGLATRASHVSGEEFPGNVHVDLYAPKRG